MWKIWLLNKCFPIPTPGWNKTPVWSLILMCIPRPEILLCGFTSTIRLIILLTRLTSSYCEISGPGSHARLRLRMGEMDVSVPDDVDLHLDSPSVGLGHLESTRLTVLESDPELRDEARASLSLDIDAVMGHVRLR